MQRYYIFQYIASFDTLFLLFPPFFVFFIVISPIFSASHNNIVPFSTTLPKKAVSTTNTITKKFHSNSNSAPIPDWT